MYNVLDICQYILDYCSAKNKGICNLKLQYILYFIQAEFLVSKNEPCFKEEIVAWGLGPVIPKAYYEYKKYGTSLISNLNKIEDATNISIEDKKIINRVLNITMNYTASDLSKITRSQTPWQNVYCGIINARISNSSIKLFFAE